MSGAEERVIEAAESVAASEVVRAEAEADLAAAAVSQSNAQTTETVVAAAEASAALAHAVAATAEHQAAAIINEKEGELEWLRQHAKTTETTLQETNSRLTETQTAMREGMGAILTALTSLTPAPSTPPLEAGNPGIQLVDPVLESAGADGQEKTALKNQQNPKGRKARRWI